jgi:Zn-dependent peptidase ImmA (M78 family)/DNA-binding XRE family transcriptional regulator
VKPHPTNNHDINPEMVTLARESRGLTQTEAAGLLGISQARLSKIEAGLLLPVPGDLVSKMAQDFHYPEQFFTLKDRVLGSGTSEYFHRKRRATSARVLRQIYAELNTVIINISRLLRSVEIDDEIPHFDPDEWTPTEIAQFVRSQWHLPSGPVGNVVDAIENAGGIVVACDFGTPHVDAISRCVLGLPRIFFVNSNLPGDRQRLTLAHELGHVVMHSLPHEDMEQQAYQFAAEFLMPKDAIKAQFSRVDIPRLAAMKPYWKVSMAALLMRARDLGKISPRMERDLWMKLSKAGYKTREPADLDIPREEPRLLNEVIGIHSEKLGYNLSELSRLIVLCEDEAQERYGIDKTGSGSQKLRLVK